MTRRVVNQYPAGVSRWEPGAAVRLRQAALELFVEQGFAHTTVPQITARAGLTTRTFFRHYADKREVLFWGEDELPAVAAQVFAAADPGATPFEVIVHGLSTVVAPRFDGMHADLRIRLEVIRSDNALRERELHKLAILADAAVTGFTARGLDPLQAAVAAQLAIAVYDTAIHRWLDDASGPPLAQVMVQVAGTFQELTR